MNLREYEQAKFALADLLRSAATLTKAEENEESEKRFRELFARLAEDRFNLVVVGRFNRGKSSLMNAILGTDRLPTGIVPLTSVITTVGYGSQEKVTLKYQQRRHLDIEVAIEDLSKYVTQQGNPGNALGIVTANIQLPAEILRRGFYFVDTPGLGSVIAENTLTTESFLPEADALLLVTSYESPLSEEELRFFRAASMSKLHVFVAINKRDLVSGNERDDAIDFVRDHLQDLFGRSAPQIFSVSARDGLEAKRSGDPSLLTASGIPDLETELVTFLLKQKRTEFLARMCDRVSDLLRELPLSDGMATLVERANELTGEFGRADGESVEAPPRETAEPLMQPHQIRSCEICMDVSEAMWDFLCRYQYDLAVDHNAQAEFAKNSGFCSFHTWEYQSVASPYGTCAGYPPLLDRLAEELRAAARAQSNTRSKIENLLPTHDDCVLCEVRDQAEAKAVAALADRLRRGRSDTLGELSAVCLPHMAALAAVIDDAAVIRSLAEHQASLLERVSEDMRRFTLKHDAVKRYLETKEEGAAAQRALLLVVGRRNVNFAVGATVPAMLKTPGVDSVLPLPKAGGSDHGRTRNA